MIKFGTGGWRALIADDFTKDNVKLVARAIAIKMEKENMTGSNFIIGYDRRFLSQESGMWCAEVLSAYGVRCLFSSDGVPTPLVMHCMEKEGMPYGLAVTASHNPALYNGIKIFTPGGKDADATFTAEIEQIIEDIVASGEEIRSIDFEKGVSQGKIVVVNKLNEYLDSIEKVINMDAIKQAGLHVAIDPMYGVGRDSLLSLLSSARCKIDIINDNHDPLFGGKLPAPSESMLYELSNLVVKNKCDFGIATDGDADRLGIIDSTGEYIHPNKILSLLYYYLLEYKGWRGDVVRNLATTHMLDKIAEVYKTTCHEVPVGFKHISENMVKFNAIIGGESSGGLTVKGHIKGKDGVYAGLLFAEMIAVSKKSIHELYAELEGKFGTYNMQERCYKFSEEKKQWILHVLMNEKQLPVFTSEVEKVTYYDGCKVYFKNGGWLSARFSGTEPLLRIFCEMSCKEEADAEMDAMQSMLEL